MDLRRRRMKMNDIQIELNPGTLYSILEVDSKRLGRWTLSNVYNYLTISSLLMVINDRVVRSKNIYGGSYV